MLKLRLFFVWATLGLMLCSCKHPCQIDALGGTCWITRCEEGGEDLRSCNQKWQARERAERKRAEQAERERAERERLQQSLQSARHSWRERVELPRAERERAKRERKRAERERKRAERERKRAERERKSLSSSTAPASQSIALEEVPLLKEARERAERKPAEQAERELGEQIGGAIIYMCNCWYRCLRIHRDIYRGHRLVCARKCGLEMAYIAEEICSVVD
jgi:hypothetical protein